jgi:hypothetical protein
MCHWSGLATRRSGCSERQAEDVQGWLSSRCGRGDPTLTASPGRPTGADPRSKVLLGLGHDPLHLRWTIDGLAERAQSSTPAS